MTDSVGSSRVGASTVEATQAAIRQTRAELGETVQALAEKADVRANLQRWVAGVRERLSRATPGHSTPGSVGPVTAGLHTGAGRLAATIRDKPFAAVVVSLVAGVLVGRRAKRAKRKQR